MIVTGFTKRTLSIRRDMRNRQRDGWEYVGDSGGNLWELHRGGRIDQVITDVAIAASGKGLWIKTAPKHPCATMKGQ